MASSKKLRKFVEMDKLLEEKMRSFAMRVVIQFQAFRNAISNRYIDFLVSNLKILINLYS